MTGRVGSVIAGVAMAAWLLTGLLSVSPAWHHWFHEDSNGAQHHCPVSKYSDGDFLNASPPATLSAFNPKPPDRALKPTTAEFPSQLSTLNSALQGRAPPLI
jgi:hypothetical protein